MIMIKLFNLHTDEKKEIFYNKRLQNVLEIDSLESEVIHVIPTSKIIKEERVLENSITYFRLYKKFIGHLVKKGKKRKGYLTLKHTFDILHNTFEQRYPVLLLLLAIIKNKPIFQLQKIRKRRREIIYPRTLSIHKRYTYGLLNIMRYGWTNVSLYKNVALSMAHSIVEHALGLRYNEIKEMNKLAEKNKYNFLIKFRNSRKKRIKKMSSALFIKSRRFKIVDYKLKQKQK